MLIGKIGEGSFSEVLKAKSIKTGAIVAIKCMKASYDSLDKVKALKEIQSLQRLAHHPHIIQLIEVLYDEPSGKLALVCELMDMNLYDVIKNRAQYLSISKVRRYMLQILKALKYMHERDIFHRDIKPENILIKNDTIKIADLGSSKGCLATHPYTEYISTRWYRAPECLMTDGYYDRSMDIWGLGTVLFEVITLSPLFQGNNELDQIHKIFKILGTPDREVISRFMKHYTHMELNIAPVRGVGLEKLMPSHVPPECVDLLYKMLVIDPLKRITAEAALQHEFFKEEQPQLNHTQKFGPYRPNVRHKQPRVFPGTINMHVEIRNNSDDEVEKASPKLPPIGAKHLKPKVQNPIKHKKKPFDDYLVVGTKAFNF